MYSFTHPHLSVVWQDFLLVPSHHNLMHQALGKTLIGSSKKSKYQRRWMVGGCNSSKYGKNEKVRLPIKLCSKYS